MSNIDFSELHSFFKSKQRNAWLNIGVYRVYVRRAYHMIEGEIVRTIDLANIVKEDSSVPYGGFWELFAELKRLSRENAIKALFLENTYNERLYEAYKQRGCLPIGYGSDPSLYTFV